jgi:hypothetical protein
VERTRPTLISLRIDDAIRSALYIGMTAALFMHCGGCAGNVQQAATKSMPVVSEEQPRIYIADWANHRIVRIDDMRGTGWVTCSEGGNGENALRFPVGI